MTLHFAVTVEGIVPSTFVFVDCQVHRHLRKCRLLALISAFAGRQHRQHAGLVGEPRMQPRKSQLCENVRSYSTEERNFFIELAVS